MNKADAFVESAVSNRVIDALCQMDMAKPDVNIQELSETVSPKPDVTAALNTVLINIVKMETKVSKETTKSTTIFP